MLLILSPENSAPISLQSFSISSIFGKDFLNRAHICWSISTQVSRSGEAKRFKIWDVMGPVPAPSSSTLPLPLGSIFSLNARPSAGLLGVMEPIVLGDFTNLASTIPSGCFSFYCRTRAEESTEPKLAVGHIIITQRYIKRTTESLRLFVFTA